MSRPTEDPSWCDDDAASKVVEPSSTKKLAGFKYLERAAFQYINWLFRNFVKWVLHLDVSVNHFDPHEAATPDMTVVITAGRIQAGITLTSVAEQTTAAFVAPVGNPRIDRIVIDSITGAYSVIAGTEAASPVAPELTVEKTAICQVLLDNSPATTEITDDLITDERGIRPASRHLVILDSPNSVSMATSKNTWQTLTDTILSDNKAVSVIISVWFEPSAGTSALGHSNSIFTRKTGSGLTTSINDGTRIGYQETRDADTGYTFPPDCHGYGLVNLDENFDFDVYLSILNATATVATARCHIIGYYK